MLPLIIIVTAAALAIFLVWWLIFETEGVYLGRRVVIWLYDVYARRYDAIKENDDLDEHLYIAQPMMQQLRHRTDPLVLDVATGTGRIPLALCQHARFEGYIIGIDLSRKMLQVAAEKIAAQHFTDYVTLLHGSAELLPFDDHVFDVVTCMESLEFMPQPERQLTEIIRVLRPGGLLLTTLRIHERWMPGRIPTAAQFEAMLSERGIEDIDIQTWQYDYMLVWGRKAGESESGGVRMPEEILRPEDARRIVPFPEIEEGRHEQTV
jgi:ubiquinone/menaquinone biosynthesis C-methylase UbiE